MKQFPFSKEPFTTLPIANVPFIAGPVIFTYNLDAGMLFDSCPHHRWHDPLHTQPIAYGTKIERLNLEAQTILRTEKHWFNQPLALPPSLKADYNAMRNESNAKLVAMGAK